MNIKARILKKPDDLSLCFEVRCEVFVGEQGFDSSIELDEYDDVAYHVLILKDDIAVATARYFEYGDCWKIGRVCVLKQYRSLKLGNILMQSIETHLNSLGVNELCLTSQTQAQGFYKKNGYNEVGEVFMEEGCPHIKMVKKINE